MTIFRALSAVLSRRSDALHAQDIVEAGAGSREASTTPAVTSPHSTQGVRPYGFGY